MWLETTQSIDLNAWHDGGINRFGFGDRQSAVDFQQRPNGIDRVEVVSDFSGTPARTAAVSNIGLGTVRLDFGDTSISRNNHAAVAFDTEQSKFFLGHGGKSNLVRLNGKPVLSTEEMSNGDQIRIGETTLKFVALCGEEFTWKSTEGADTTNA